MHPVASGAEFIADSLLEKIEFSASARERNPERSRRRLAAWPTATDSPSVSPKGSRADRDQLVVFVHHVDIATMTGLPMQRTPAVTITAVSMPEAGNLYVDP